MGKDAMAPTALRLTSGSRAPSGLMSIPDASQPLLLTGSRSDDQRPPGRRWINLRSSPVSASSLDESIGALDVADWSVDMPALMDLARAHGVAVIEDCAQVHGATVDFRSVGAFGGLAAFSFCQDKIITTGGEGGLLAMDDDA